MVKAKIKSTSNTISKPKKAQSEKQQLASKTQAESVLSKETALTRWNQYKKESQEKHRKHFNISKEEARQILPQIKEGKIIPQPELKFVPKRDEKGEIIYYKTDLWGNVLRDKSQWKPKMEYIPEQLPKGVKILPKWKIRKLEKVASQSYEEYHKEHPTSAERDEKTWDLHIVSPQKPYSFKSKSRPKEILWMEDPSKSDYPNVDTPQATREKIVEKRAWGKRYVEVADSQAILNEKGNRFDEPFFAKALKFLKGNAHKDYERKMNDIPKKNETQWKWKKNRIQLQRGMYNEAELMRSKKFLLDQMEDDFKQLGKMEDEFKKLPTSYKIPDNYFDKSTGKKVPHPDGGNIKSIFDSKDLSKNKRLQNYKEKRDKFQEKLTQFKYGESKAQAQLELLERKTELTKKLNSPTLNKYQKGNIKKQLDELKGVHYLPAKEYALLQRKASGLYNHHALMRDAITEQEKLLKSHHNVFGATLRKSIHQTKKTDKMFQDLTQLGLKGQDIENLITQEKSKRNPDKNRLSELDKQLNSHVKDELNLLEKYQNMELDLQTISNLTYTMNWVKRIENKGYGCKHVSELYDKMEFKLEQQRKAREKESKELSSKKAKLPSEVMDIEELLNTDNLNNKQKEKLGRLIELSERKKQDETTKSEIISTIQYLKGDKKVLKWYDIYHRYLKPKKPDKKLNNSLLAKIGKLDDKILELNNAVVKQHGKITKDQEKKRNEIIEKINKLKNQSKEFTIEDLKKAVAIPYYNWKSNSFTKMGKGVIAKQESKRDKPEKPKTSEYTQSNLSKLTLTEIRDIAKPIYDSSINAHFFTDKRQKKALINGILNYQSSKGKMTTDEYITNQEKIRADQLKKEIAELDKQTKQKHTTKKGIPESKTYSENEKKWQYLMIKHFPYTYSWHKGKSVEFMKEQLEKKIKGMEVQLTNKKELGSLAVRLRDKKQKVKELFPDKRYYLSNDEEKLDKIIASKTKNVKSGIVNEVKSKKSEPKPTVKSTDWKQTISLTPKKLEIDKKLKEATEKLTITNPIMMKSLRNAWNDSAIDWNYYDEGISKELPEKNRKSIESKISQYQTEVKELQDTLYSGKMKLSEMKSVINKLAFRKNTLVYLDELKSAQSSKIFTKYNKEANMKELYKHKEKAKSEKAEEDKIEVMQKIIGLEKAKKKLGTEEDYYLDRNLSQLKERFKMLAEKEEKRIKENKIESRDRDIFEKEYKRIREIATGSTAEELVHFLNNQKSDSKKKTKSSEPKKSEPSGHYGYTEEGNLLHIQYQKETGKEPVTHGNWYGQPESKDFQRWVLKKEIMENLGNINERSMSELSELTNNDLKEIAKNLKTKVTGKKPELIKEILKKADEIYAESFKRTGYTPIKTSLLDNKWMKDMLGLDKGDFDSALSTDNTSHMDKKIGNHLDKLEKQYEQEIAKEREPNAKKFLENRFEIEYTKRDILRDYLFLQNTRVNEDEKVYEKDLKQFEETAKRKLRIISHFERENRELRKKIMEPHHKIVTESNEQIKKTLDYQKSEEERIRVKNTIIYIAKRDPFPQQKEFLNQALDKYEKEFHGNRKELEKELKNPETAKPEVYKKKTITNLNKQQKYTSPIRNIKDKNRSEFEKITGEKPMRGKGYGQHTDTVKFTNWKLMEVLRNKGYDSVKEYSKHQIDSLSTSDLKEIAKGLHIKPEGKKNDLIQKIDKRVLGLSEHSKAKPLGDNLDLEVIKAREKKKQEWITHHTDGDSFNYEVMFERHIDYEDKEDKKAVKLLLDNLEDMIDDKEQKQLMRKELMKPHGYAHIVEPNDGVETTIAKENDRISVSYRTLWGKMNDNLPEGEWDYDELKENVNKAERELEYYTWGQEMAKFDPNPVTWFVGQTKEDNDNFEEYDWKEIRKQIKAEKEERMKKADKRNKKEVK